MAMDLRCESTDCRTELLSPMGETTAAAQSWRLNVSDFQMPEGPKDPSFVSRVFRRAHGSLSTFKREKMEYLCLIDNGLEAKFVWKWRRQAQKVFHKDGKQSKIAKYYKKQEKLLQGFNEMESITELGCLAGAPTEDELRELAKSERMAINISNFANLILFAAKVCASIESKSLAVIASTLDSLLDLLSGFILWFTSYAMKKPNQYSYPIGKKRMQPVGIIVFASVMATLGFQVILESGRELITQAHPTFDHEKEKWMVGIMASVTIVKFVLMLYCRSFQNDIVRAYAQDHFFDVITNSIGLATALLAVRFYWWMDPVGAILIALYTISTWAKTVLENVWSLVGKTAPPEYLTKLTYLIWNHHEEIRHIDTVRAYTFGSHYFVEVDIVLPGNMPLSQAHDIGETLQEKLEQLPEVERAFVHVDFEFTHRPEHKTKV